MWFLAKRNGTMWDEQRIRNFGALLFLLLRSWQRKFRDSHLLNRIACSHKAHLPMCKRQIKQTRRNKGAPYRINLCKNSSFTAVRVMKLTRSTFAKKWVFSFFSNLFALREARTATYAQVSKKHIFWSTATHCNCAMITWWLEWMATMRYELDKVNKPWKLKLINAYRILYHLTKSHSTNSFCLHSSLFVIDSPTCLEIRATHTKVVKIKSNCTYVVVRRHPISTVWSNKSCFSVIPFSFCLPVFLIRIFFFLCLPLFINIKQSIFPLAS